MRPRAIREVAELVREGESFQLSLKDFLDEFYSRPDGNALVEEPALLEGTVENGMIYDAYLAATAEYLASRNRFDTPSWTYADERKLHRPWFALEMASLRAVLLLESPAAFRSRNLFVSENALSRA